MESRTAPRMGWRILILVGIILAVGLGAVALYQGQRDEAVRCVSQDADGAIQEFEFSINADVGEGCRYAIDAARADQQAQWWWYASAAALAMTLGFLPLSATWPRGVRRDGADPDEE